MTHPGQLQLSLGSERQILKVSELNTAIQRLFTNAFTQVWVAGEISGCRTAASGHHYFNLKDSESQIKCVLFRGTARLTRIKPQDGLAVAIQGNLEVYQARGEYQMIVERLELHGAGSLQIAFEQLKSQLAQEGLFRAERKRVLPRLPRRIGLITSLSGAVLQDILQILGRRFPGLHVRIYPAQVQGEGSAEQLCTALRHFSESGWAEVVILARGGGSIEDLWSFNDERLARAIAAATMPVISAVGHETDFTIADFVSDYRAPTPSAAAEIVTCTRESLLVQLAENATRLARGLRYRLMAASRDVSARGRDGGALLIRRAITHRMQRVDEADQQMRRSMQRGLDARRRELAELGRRLQETNLPLRLSRNQHRRELLSEQLAKSWRAAYWKMRQRVDIATSHLVQLSPLDVLARGYAIVEKTSGQIVRAADEAAIGEELKIRVHSGKLAARVTSLEPGNGGN